MSSSHCGPDCEAVVIGAGPYGLSVGAHLQSAGVETRVFGDPMSFWRLNMPKGMRLRSPLGATSLSDPTKAFALDSFALRKNAPLEEPLPLERFVDYGLWFQSCALQDIDRRLVVHASADSEGFRLSLSDGETIGTRRLVVATGLERQQFIPNVFAGLPSHLATHTVAHADLSPFAGKRVAVVGRGQSAIESAALLHERGAEVEIFANGPIRWLGGAAAKDPLDGLRRRLATSLAAPSAVGPFPLNWIAEWPALTRLASERARLRFNERCLRAAAAGWLQPRLQGIRVNSDGRISSAIAIGDRVVLRWDGGQSSFDHVLLATGYAVDIAKLGFLAPDLLGAVKRRGGAPVLSANFETSVAGLYFVGAAAVASFGPLMRFIAGSGYAARSLTRAMARGGQAERGHAGKSGARAGAERMRAAI